MSSFSKQVITIYDAARVMINIAKSVLMSHMILLDLSLLNHIASPQYHVRGALHYLQALRLG